MRPIKGREVWEAAKIVAAGAALMSLVFGIAFGLCNAIAFPERQRIVVVRDLTHSLPPVDQPTNLEAYRAAEAMTRPARSVD